MKVDEFGNDVIVWDIETSATNVSFPIPPNGTYNLKLFSLNANERSFMPTTVYLNILPFSKSLSCLYRVPGYELGPQNQAFEKWLLIKVQAGQLGILQVSVQGAGK